MIGLLWTNLEFYSGYWVMIYCEQAINVYPWRDWIYIFKLLEPFFFLSSVYEHALCMKAFSSLFVLFFVCFFPFPWLEGGMSVQIFLKCIFSDMKFKGVCVGWGGGCNCFLSKKVETSFHSFVYFLWVQVHTLLVYWQSISVTLLLLLIVPGCPLLSLFQWSGLSDGLDTKGKTLPKNTQQVNLVGKKIF